MANDQISLDEFIKSLNTTTTKGVEDFEWKIEPIEPLTTYSITNGGISSNVHPSYGAVPNMAISGSTMNTTSINVTSPIWTTNTSAGSFSFANQNIEPQNKVHIKGKDADLLINDKSLKTWMERVEERLNILTPNPEMEKEWDQLRKLGERYRKLEKKCQEKSDMWNKLKAMPKPDIK